MGAAAINIEIRYYGALNEAIGRPVEKRQVAPGTTVNELIAQLHVRYPTTSRISVTAACNNKFAAPESEITEGDQIDLFPPFAGG